MNREQLQEPKRRDSIEMVTVCVTCGQDHAEVERLRRALEEIVERAEHVELGWQIANGALHVEAEPG